LDALTQLLEPFVSNKANPLTDALCREGILRASRSLGRAYEHGDEAEARQEMALASLLGGLALANAKLGAVHGFAAVLGGMFSAPHGAVCAALLPYVMAINVKALTERQPEHIALQRYDEIAGLVTGNSKATAQDGVAWIEALGRSLQIPGLASYGLTRSDFPTVIEKSAGSSSMQGNPLKLTPDELHEILNRAF
jgi:alcohol dehydrogenase class IV